MGKDVRCGFAGLNDSLVVVPTVVELPMLLVDVELEAIVSRELGGINAVNDLDAEIEGVLAVAFDAYALAHNRSRDNVNALLRKFGACIRLFVYYKLSISNKFTGIFA